MSNINKQCTGPEQWDLIIDRCVTRISDLAFKSLPWTQFMADKTYLDGQNLMAALDKFAEAGLRRRKNRLADTPANKRNLIHIVMHFIAPMLLLFVRMMPRYRGRWGRNLRSQGFSIMARCDASTDFLVEPLSFIITYVEPDIAGKRAGESNTEQLSWHWPGDDESILLIFALIIDMTIWPIVNAAIASQPEPGRKIPELLGCWEEPDWNGGPYARIGTHIIDHSTGA